MKTHSRSQSPINPSVFNEKYDRACRNTPYQYHELARFHSGMTLIELLIVLLILTVGIAAIVKFQGYYYYYADLSRQRAEATVLGYTELDTLSNFQVLNATSGYTAYSNIASGSTTTSVNNTSYTTSYTITTHTNPNYKTANITISWTDRYNITQSITITSIIAGIDPVTSGVLIYG